jgi:hypothetical protein
MKRSIQHSTDNDYSSHYLDYSVRNPVDNPTKPSSQFDKKRQKIISYSFDLLPIEVINQIINHCSHSCIIVLSVTGKLFYNIILPTIMGVSRTRIQTGRMEIKKEIFYIPFFSGDFQVVVMKDIFKNNYQKVLKWYFEYFASRNITERMSKNRCNNFMCLAAQKGNLDIIKLAIIECGFLYSNRICGFAAKNGNLEILEWIKEKNYALNPNIYSFAALGGHLNILKRYAQR